MNVKDVLGKVSGVIGKLPFVKLAGNIPEGIRGKIPVVNMLIPFANHIACGLAVVVLAACLGGGGGMSGSEWASPKGTSYFRFSGSTFKFIMVNDGLVFEGSYTLSGDTLTLDFPDDEYQGDNVFTTTMIGDAFPLSGIFWFPDGMVNVGKVGYGSVDLTTTYRRR
jgi:hypothetical protein